MKFYRFNFTLLVAINVNKHKIQTSCMGGDAGVEAFTVSVFQTTAFLRSDTLYEKWHPVVPS